MGSGPKRAWDLSSSVRQGASGCASCHDERMRIGVFGTGVVGRTIAAKLVGVGHDVCLGSRSADNEVAAGWVGEHGERASAGTFADAAAFGELCFNCTHGDGAVAAVTSAAEGLDGKVLVDVSNPVDFGGDVPTLSVGLTDSLGERLQRALPTTAVVKALNTMSCDVMVDPGLVAGEHVAFVCGNDATAKARTVAVLGEFGWPSTRVVDLGDITGARACEAYVLTWQRLLGWVGNTHFNIEVHREA